MISSRRRWFLRLVPLLLLSLPIARPAPAQAPAPPQPGDQAIERYLAQQTARLSQGFLAGASTRAEWEARRPRLYQEYLDMLGLWPLPARTPLHAASTGTLERGPFVVDKLHFQSRPGLYVTGNLYRPKKVEGKLPAILYVCGHSGRGRDGNKAAFQDHGMWFASNGYICLVVDTLQLGEIPGLHHGTYNRERWWWQALGYSPASVECWNGIRAIDYLVSRPDVDAERIGVTGISGGGAATFWIAAADERVRCAVPVSGMSDLESYVTNKVINGHCDCMFLVNTYGWEWTTIAALVAPRPLLFANSDNDRIFPMDGNRRISARLRQHYKLYDKPELVADYVSAGGHDYRPDLRIAVFQWINRHLKRNIGPVQDAAFPFFPDRELRVFPEDKDIPADAINGKIDETFVQQHRVNPESPFATWKEHVLRQLATVSVRMLPSQVSKATLNKEVKAKEGTQVLTTEPGIEVTVVQARPEQGNAQGGSLIVLNPNEDPQKIPEWAAPLVDKGTVLLLAPRGAGPTAWTRKSPPNYVERAHALLGTTVDQGRVWDIAATILYLQGEGRWGPQWKILGRGQAGILGAAAAVAVPQINEVVVADPPTSFREGPIFLNALRAIDVPDLLGLLAPRPLTLVRASDKAFERTAAIYQLAGAQTKLQRN